MFDPSTTSFQGINIQSDDHLQDSSVVPLGMVSSWIVPCARPVGSIGHPGGLFDLEIWWQRAAILLFGKSFLLHCLLGVVHFTPFTDGLRETIDPHLELIVLSLDPPAVLHEIRPFLILCWISFQAEVAVWIPWLNGMFSAKWHPHLSVCS